MQDLAWARCLHHAVHVGRSSPQMLSLCCEYRPGASGDLFDKDTAPNQKAESP